MMKRLVLLRLLALLVIAVGLLAHCRSDERIEVYRVVAEGESVADAQPAARSGDPHGGAAAAELPSGHPPPSAPQAGAAAGGDPHAGIGIGGLPAGHPPAGGDARPVGKVPKGWEPGQASAMRQASFLVRGDGGAVADASLVILGGAAGGLLDNVNRWRAQLGLEALDQAALEVAIERVVTPAGEALVVDIEGTPQAGDEALDGRTLAAVIERPDEVWFYKLRGNPALVGRHKQAFLDWIASIGPQDLEAAPQAPATE